MYWFLLNAVVVIFSVYLVTKKYGTILNPVGFYAAFYLMAAVGAPLLYLSLGLYRNISSVGLAYASGLSSLYFAAIGFAFLVGFSPFKIIFARLFRFMRPLELKEQANLFSAAGMLAQFSFLFLLLMSASGAGLLWITNSREAYQFHRTGVGVLWSLTQASLMLAFICVIFRIARNATALAFTVAIFAGMALFLGSKAYVLSYFVLAVFYYHFKIKKISTLATLLLSFSVFIFALALQIYQGTAADLLRTLLYFDYFNNSAALVDRFHDFGFRYGSLTLSNLWYFVPRAIYPSKPLIYGSMTTTEFLYPGSTELYNAYPGVMQWTVGFADFGMMGVVAYGMFAGLLAKGAYELFLEERDIQSMAVFAQLGLIYYVELFPNAPFIIFFLWLVMEIGLIRCLSIVNVLFPVRIVGLVKSTRAAGHPRLKEVC